MRQPLFHPRARRRVKPPFSRHKSREGEVNFTEPTARTEGRRGRSPGSGTRWQHPLEECRKMAPGAGRAGPPEGSRRPTPRWANAGSSHAARASKNCLSTSSTSVSEAQGPGWTFRAIGLVTMPSNMHGRTRMLKKKPHKTTKRKTRVPPQTAKIRQDVKLL